MVWKHFFGGYFVNCCSYIYQLEISLVKVCVCVCKNGKALFQNKWAACHNLSKSFINVPRMSGVAEITTHNPICTKVYWLVLYT